MVAEAGWNRDVAEAVIARHRGEPGAALIILRGLQEAFGFVPRAVLPLVAEALNLSRAEIYGVFSFYHDLRERPAGRHVLRLCRSEACQSMGAVALAEQMRQALGIGWGETTADGRVTLEAVYCLGLCAMAPAGMLDGEVHGRLDRARLAGLVGGAA